MMKKSLYSGIKEALALNRLDRAFELLREMEGTGIVSSSFDLELQHLQNRYKELDRRYKMGVMGSSEIAHEKARITHALLDLLHNLESATNQPPAMDFYDLINSYLRHELSQEEHAAFEQALKTDADLAYELDFQRSLKAAAGHRAAQAQAKDIMAHLRSKGIFENAAQQAERDRQLLESAEGDPEAIARLLAEHPSLADWKALDPEGFGEVVQRSTPVLAEKQPAKVVVPVWVWVRRVAAVAAVVVLGWAGYFYLIAPKEHFDIEMVEIIKDNDSTKNLKSPIIEKDVSAKQDLGPKPGEDKDSENKQALPILRGDSFARNNYSKPTLTATSPSELVSVEYDFEPETVISLLNKGSLSEAKEMLSGCDETDCLYLLGHIFFQETAYDSAVVYFERAWQNRQKGMTFLKNRYQDDLEYYRALALLGADEIEKADVALEAISNKRNHPYVSKAKSLLKAIRTAQLRTGMHLLKSSIESLSLRSSKPSTAREIEVMNISLALSKALAHSFL